MKLNKNVYWIIAIILVAVIIANPNLFKKEFSVTTSLTSATNKCSMYLPNQPKIYQCTSGSTICDGSNYCVVDYQAGETSQLCIDFAELAGAPNTAWSYLQTCGAGTSGCSNPTGNAGNYICQDYHTKKCVSGVWANIKSCVEYIDYTTPCATENVIRSTETLASYDCTLETPVVTQTCTDSDGGSEYFVKGTVKINTGTQNYTFNDYCNGTKIVEYYCDGYNNAAYIGECPDGCASGKCISTTPPVDNTTCAFYQTKQDDGTCGLNIWLIVGGLLALVILVKVMNKK